MTDDAPEELAPLAAAPAQPDRSQTLQGPVIPFTGQDLVQYDTASGEILNALTLPLYAAAPLLAQPGYLAGKGGTETHYVDLSGPTLKEKVPGTPTVRGTDLLDLPIPTRVTVFMRMPDGTLLWEAFYDVDDGSAELSFAHPGTYVASLRCAPWLKTEIELVAE